MVQSYRQAVAQHDGRDRRKEPTDYFLVVLNLTMKMEAECSSTRTATQLTSKDRA
jgi:hypothetical protein